MGWGDDLLYIHKCEQLRQGKTVRPTRKTRPRQLSALWKNISWIDPQGELDIDELEYANNEWARAYQQGNYTPTPPETQLLVESDYNLAQHIQTKHKAYTLICPDVKETHHDVNKTWYHWQDLCNILEQRGHNIVRLTHREHSKRYKNTTDYVTANIRQSLAVVDRADLVVTTDGFWHHASAYTKTNCVTIYGSCTSDKDLGYPEQANITTLDEHSPCYTIHKKCEKCVENMWNISAKAVMLEIVNRGWG